MSASPGPRGAHVLDAVAGVLADHGLAALSMRTVAARAGVSVAQVQYYFRTRTELVRAAFDHAGAQFLATLDTVDDETSLTALSDVLLAWLPLDDEREARARVWLAYAAASAADAGLAAESARLDAQLRAWFADRLGALEAAGEVAPGPDVEIRAATLLALVDGLTLQALSLPRGERRALAVGTLEAWLDGLRPPGAASVAGHAVGPPA